MDKSVVWIRTRKLSTLGLSTRLDLRVLNELVAGSSRCSANTCAFVLVFGNTTPLNH